MTMYFSCCLLDSSMLVVVRDLQDFLRKPPDYFYTAPEVVFPGAVWQKISRM